jgi:hypothetical protein
VFPPLKEFGFEQFQLKADGAKLVFGEEVQILIGSTIGRGSQYTLKALWLT